MFLKYVNFGLIPQLQPGSCILPSVFSLVRPHIDFSFHGILSHINTVFVLRSKVDIIYDCFFLPHNFSERKSNGKTKLVTLFNDLMYL